MDIDDDDMSDSDVSSENVEQGSSMMNLLSSYYGTEEKISTPISEGRPSDIDSACFDHFAYVKNLFDTKDVYELMKHDSKMVHDIKGLDSDMQMLVYENYNKFISATETIKRMKKNVEAMDEDMDAVRTKMESISLNTKELDKTLADKRTKIDKLVRVTRLLHRLEFLSELPERLETMIEKEMYKAAIQLYRKTIKVLKKQSHVLSFKKIQEKTEHMMIDLRGKVLSLFDSHNLEAQQLTQYVGILRMMNCSRSIIIEKFLSAHKYRSLRMIKQFLQDLNASQSGQSQSQLSSDNNNNNNKEEKSVQLSVQFVRTFHQSLLVGLIEASKGIKEIFSDKDEDSNSYDTELQDNDSSDKQLLLSSAYDELQAMIGLVVLEYLKCVTKSIKLFFNRYDKAYLEAEEDSKNENSENLTLKQQQHKQHSAIEKRESDDDDDDSASGGEGEGSDDVSDDDEKKSNNRMSQPSYVRDSYGMLVLPQWEEERNVWIALTRQIILDCQYLDSATESCRPVNCDPSLPHSDSVAENVLALLDSHFDDIFAKRMKCFQEHLIRAANSITTICSNTKTTQGHGDHETAEVQSSSRGTIQAKLSQAKGVMESLIESFDEVFVGVCKDARAIVDTHAVSRVGTADTSVQLMWRYCNSVADVAESFGGSSLRPVGCNKEIHDEQLSISDKAYHAPNTDDDAVVCLLASTLFSRIATNLTSRLEACLRAVEMSAVSSEFLRERCLGRIENSSLALVEAFIQYHSESFSSLFSQALKAAILTDKKAIDVLITSRDLFVSPSMIEAGRRADSITLVCCAILAEVPPAAQSRSFALDRNQDMGSGAQRRSSTTGHGGGHQGYHHSLQLDIERMFSRKIKIFDFEGVTLSLETILNMITKAALKSYQQNLRFRVVDQLAYIQIYIDATFAKQIFSCFLKDSADIESLTDDILATLQTRCMDDVLKKDIPSVLPRSVNDGLYNAGKICLLLQR